jgi:UDP-GlcNAc3NAcA epimerase
MRILSVVGTRPQIIKAAALQGPLRARHHDVLVDTGQHWDDEMAGGFFTELGLAAPAYSLGAGGGTHAEQTAAMLTGLEPIREVEQPEAVLVYGDTNSTLAGAIAAAKAGLPVAHVEAGLRSFDRRMPEEINRIVADHLSSWLFAPTRTAVENLRSEGITRGVSLVGDLMQDLVAGVANNSRQPDIVAAIGRDLGGRLADCLIPGGYVFATVHRQENRSAGAIRSWADILARMAAPNRPVVLALHPGTAEAVRNAGVRLGPDVLVIRPQSYRTSIALQLSAAAVVTDSGGIQREAAWLGVPCLLLRESTEWPELLQESGGLSVLVGLDAERAVRAFTRVVRAEPVTPGSEAREPHAIRPAGAAEAIALALDAVPPSS